MPSNVLLRWTKSLAKKLMGNESRRSRRMAAIRTAPARWRPTLELLEERVTPTTNWVVSLSTPDNAATAGTLRYAVTNSVAGDIVTFAPALSGATISLASTLPIAHNLTIVGLGANNLTIAGTLASFGSAGDISVPAGVTASISNLSITNGLASYGAGVNNAGTLSLSNDLINNDGVAANQSVIYGAGIYNTGTLDVNECLINGNYAWTDGGGIYNSGTATISDTTFTGNGGYTVAGAIENTGTMTLSNDTITANVAWNNTGASPTGDGIYSTGTLTASDTISSGNYASSTDPDADATFAAGSINNAIGNAAGVTGLTNGTNGNQLGTAVTISALAANGGPTQSMALPAGSIAIAHGGALTTVGTAIAAAGNSIVLTNSQFLGNSAGTGPMVIQIGTEQMLVTAVAGNTAASAVTVVRGYNGTTAATHAAGANVTLVLDQRGDAVPVATATGDVGAYQTTGVAPGTPTVTGVGPNSGPLAGGTSVTITGTNLANATGVYFGGIPATIVSDSGTVIVVTDPAGTAGTVDVTVTTVGWDTSAIVAADHFTYSSGPTTVYAESLSAGVLAITMAVPTASANLQFSLAGGIYTFTDGSNNGFGTPTGSGAASITGGGTATITIPTAAITSISVTLGTGTNVFNLTGTGGASAAPITVLDGTTAGDQVIVSGAVLDSGAVALTGNAISESGTGTLNAGANTVNLTATTSITQAAAGVITGGAVAITAGTVGTTTQSVVLNATTLTSTTAAGNGVQYLADTATVSLASASALNAGTGLLFLTGGTFKETIAAALPATANLVMSGTAILDMNAFSTTVATLNGAGGTITDSSATPATLTVTGGGTFGGSITGAATSLTDSGATTLTLSGVSTYGGATTISAGTLTIGVNNALPATTAVTIGPAAGGVAVLNLNNFNATVAQLTYNAPTGGAQTETTLGTGTLTLNGSLSLVNNTSAAGNSYGINITGTGALNLGGAVRTINIAGQNNGGYDMFILAPITNGGLIVNGIPSTTQNNATGLELEAVNTFALGLQINEGNVETTVAGAMPAASTLIMGGTTAVNGANATFNMDGFSQTVAGILNGTGAVAADNTITSTAATLTDTNTAGSFTYAGTITGAISLVKSGASTQALTNTANTFSGTTTISGGVLTISGDAGLGTAPAAATPGKLVINGGTLQAAASFTLSSNRGIALGPTTGTGTGTIDVTAGNTLTYGGVAANNGGVGGLTLTDTGTLVLSAPETYTGATTVASGILAGATTVTAITSTGGAINAGPVVPAVGILNAPSANLSAGGNLTLEVAAATTAGVGYSQLNLGAGTLTLGGTSSLTLDLAGLTPTNGTILNAIVAGSIVGTFTTVNVINNAGVSAFVSYAGAVMTINLYVPTATTITAVSGSLQSAVVTAGFTNPLVVTVLDQHGVTMAGTTVTFTAPASGASAKFSNSTNTISAATNGAGQLSEVVTAGTGAGTYSISVTDGAATPATFSLTNTPGVMTQIGFVQVPATSLAGVALAPAVKIATEDTYGNVETSDNASTLTIAVNSGPAGGAFTSGSTTVAVVSAGVATFSNLVLSTAGAYTFKGSDVLPGYTTPASSTSTIAAAPPAAQLAFGVQPTTVVAGAAITPAVTVKVEDQYGNVLTGDSTSTLTVSIASGPVGGAFVAGSTTTVLDVAGVATFSNLKLSLAGSYTLKVTDASPALTSPTSSSFVVTPGTATQIAFGTQPTSVTAGAAISPQVTAMIEDSFGNVETADNSSTLSIAIVSGPGGGVFAAGSTASVTVLNGVASFTTLKLNTAGAYTLQASDAAPTLTSPASNIFVVNPSTATQLVFGQQPTNVVAGVAISPAVTVKIEDTFGNVESNDYASSLTMAVASGPGGLAGTTSVTVNAGVATFSNLMLTTVGADTLKATDVSPALTSAASNSITVSPNVAAALVVTQQPSATAIAGVAFGTQPVVKEEDAFGNVITTDSTHTVTAARGNLGAGALLGGTLTVTLVNGVATFPASDLTYDVAETMNLRFSSNLGTVTAATSNNVVVSPNVAAQLKVTQQPPASAVAGVAFTSQPVVAEEDQYGNIITTDSTHTVTAATGTQGTASLLGSALTETLSGGVATFPAGDLSYNVAQTMNIGFTTTAGAFTTTSNNVVVTSSAATHFTVSPAASANAGSPFSVTVTALDFNNNVVTNYTGTIHLTSSDTGASSPVAPTFPANYTFTVGVGADDGVHTFSAGTNGVTLVTSGSQTVIATDTTAPTVQGTGGITINSLAATHLVLSAVSPQAITVPFTVTLTAEDPYNNPSSSYADKVHLTTTDLGIGAVVPADYIFTSGVGAGYDNGVHVFTNGFTLVTAGLASLTATDVNVPAPIPAVSAGSISITASSATVQVAPVVLPNPQVGVAYSQVVTSLGGTGATNPYTLSVSGTLPTGLTFTQTSGTTGLISGTPTAGGLFNFTIQSISSSSQTGSRLYSVTVAAPAITMTPTSLTSVQAGVLFNQTFVAAGGTAGYTYSVIAGTGSAPYNTLPAGITLNANTGVLSGTPTATGPFNFTIQALDHSTGSGPFNLQQSYTWTINAPTLVINPVVANLPAGQVGVPYSQTLTGAGGTAAYSFAITFGQLPGGLTLSPAGLISGTPTSGGPYAITVKMTDSTAGGGPYTTTINYGLTISPPNLSFAAQPNAQVGAFYSQNIVGAGGTAPYRLFSYGFGTGTAPFNTLPAGLTGSTAGVISGIATAGGTYSIQVTATDSSSGTGPYTFTQNITLVVTAPSITFSPNPMPAATDAVFYTQALTPAGSTAPFSNFVVHSGNLPSGLTLSSSGVVSGTPTEGGTFNFVVWVTDSSTGNGPYTTGQNVTLTVNPPTFVFSPSASVLSPAQVGVAGYSSTFTVTGGTPGYGSFITVNGTGSAPFNTLPTGMALSPAGVLQGVPTAAGTFNFSVQTTDSSSFANGGHGPYSEQSQNYSITVTAPVITLTPATLPNDQVGVSYTQAIIGSGGTAPYTNFTISAGALPPGLTISPAGIISGVATGGGLYSFTVSAQDSSGGTGPFPYSQTFTLTSTPPAITMTPVTPPLGQVGVFYSQALTGAGGTAPYGNFVVTGGTLPAGLTLSLGGVISGIPTAGGTFNFTVTASDSSSGIAPYIPSPHYTGSQNFTITLNPPAFVFTPNALTTPGQVGVPYSQAFTVTGGTAPYGNFVVSAGTGTAPYNTIPGGLTLNPSTGLLSGTPTSTGTFNFTIKASDSSTGSGPFTQGQTYTLIVGTPTLVFTPTTLVGGQAGVNFSQQFTIAGGSAPYHNFTITAGALPADVTLSGSGLLSGAPGATGTFTFTVQGTDSSTGGGPYSISQAFTWTIAAPVIVLSPATLPGAEVGVAYSEQIVGSAGTAPYHGFTVTGGALPTGLTLSGSGLITGTPSEGGSFSLQLMATDSTTGPGSPFTSTLVATLVVAPPNISILPSSLPAARVGVTYSQTLSPSGGTAPYRFFQVTSGALPAGLTLSIGGLLSGTPTAGGAFTFTVQTTDSSTGSGPFVGTQTYSNFQVNIPIFVFTPSPLPTVQVGASYTQAISISGGTAPYSNFTVNSGSLPAGLTLSTAGVVSGTPTQNGVFNFTVQATDSSTGAGAPYTESQGLTLTVNTPTFVFSPAILPAAQVGAAFSQPITIIGGTAPYHGFTVSVGTGSAPYNTLPAGLTLNSSTGLLSGTPTAGGVFNFNVSATDSSSGSGPFTQSIHYTLSAAAPTFVFSPNPLSAGQAGVAVSQPISITGGTAPYSNFLITSGTGSAPFNKLPAGVTLSPSGLLSGTPTATGMFSFNIEATDSSTVNGPYTELQAYTWTINAPTLVINPVATSLPTAQAGVPYTEALIGSGGTAPYVSFQIVGGQLPGGLTLASNGVISGTPTSGGPFSITVQMTDSTTGTGPFSTQVSYGLTVNPPSLGFAAQPAAQVGAVYNQAIVGVGGTAPYRLFTYAPGTGSAPFNVLPIGLTASPAGVISGTATAGGTYNIMVTATDSSSGSGPYTFTQDLVLVVNAPSIVFTPNPMPAAQDGAFYSQTLTAGGGTAPYSNFFVQSGALPSGLTLSHGGTISGTPTESGTFSFVVDVTDSSTNTGPYTTGSLVSLTVNAPTFVFSPSPVGLNPAQVGAAGYSTTFTITGGTAPYSSFAITGGALPAGMSLSSSGVLTGTPTAGGAFNFTVSATDSSLALNGGNGPYTESQNYTLAVTPPTISLNPTTLPNDQVGQSYSETITGSGGTAPYSNFTISGGALPPGLSISSAGTISGVATGGGTYFFTVQAQDSSTGAGPYTYAQSFTLTSTKPTITFTPTTPANAQIGVNYSQTLTAAGGTAPYGSFVIAGGALPAGLTLSAAGVITGVPTAGGTFNFTVQAADSSTGIAPFVTPPAYTSTQSFTLVVTPPALVFSPTSLTTTAQVGVPYSQTFTVAGGSAPYGSFTLAAGIGSAPYNSAPAGLTINPATGALSGMPTSSGTFTFTVLATDSSTNAGPYSQQSQVYTLTVNAPTLVFTPTTLATAQAGVNFTQPFTITGGSAPYHNFTVISGALPSGVTISNGGVLSGAPSAVGTFNFTVQGTDSTTGNGPYSITQAFTWTTTAPTVVLSPATLPSATDGASYTEQIVGSGGTAPYNSFVLTGGALPAGLTMNSSGLITGTPTAAGVYSFSLTADDSTTGPGAPYSANLTCSLTINSPSVSILPASLTAAQVGVNYSQAFSGAGGTAPYRFWTLTAGALPAGLTLSLAGVLSGTPTAGGTFNFTVQTTDSSTGTGPFTATHAYTLTVAAATITFSPASLTNAKVGVSYTQLLTGAGGTAPYSNFTISAGALPAGVTLSTSGTLSGTPTAGGTFNFTVSAKDSSTGTGPYTASQIYALTVTAPSIVFSPSTLTAGQVGAAYSQILTGSGGTAPYSSFTISAGALPAGVTLSSSGTLSGTPTAGGTFSFTVSAKDASTGNGPYTANQVYSLTVAAPTITFTPAALTDAQVGAGYSQTLTGSGGTAPYASFTISGGALPAGLTLSSSGTISGTPTAGGTFSFTVSASDSSTGSGPYNYSQSYSLIVANPTITFGPATLTSIQVGAGYSQLLTGFGGTAPFTNFTVISGSLPTGLTLSSSGILSGTPTAGGAFSFTIQARDSSTGTGPFTASQSYAGTVAAPSITFSPATLTGVQVGTPYTQALSGVGGTAPYSAFTSSGTLPTGLTLSASGVLTGTPTAGGTFNFTVQALDSSTGSGPYTASQAYSVTVAAPSITFSPASLTGVRVGVSYTQALTGSGGTAPYTNFLISVGALPAGLTLSSGGTISGTPTAGGIFNFTVSAKDSSTGSGPFTASQAYTVTVAAPTIVFNPSTLTGAQVGAAFSQALTGSGGTAPYVNFTLSSGALPAGLTLSSSGLLSGTPTAGGAFSFSIAGTDSSTGTGPFTTIQAYSVTVANPSITLSPGSLTNAELGANFTQALIGVGGTAPYTSFAISAGALPAGITLSPSGTLTGTPTASGNFSFTVSAKDSSTGTGPFAFSQSYTLTVLAPSIVVASGSPQSATVNTAFAGALVVTVDDQFGHPIVGQSVTFTAPASGASGNFSNSSNVITGTTNASGQISEPFTADTASGSYSVTATTTGATSPATFSLTNAVGVADHLAFVSEPGNILAGFSFSPAVTVQVVDQFGNRVTTNSSTVTIGIGSNPGSGSLSGTASMAAVSGLATFSNLSVNKAGTGYTLVALDGALGGGFSTSFNVTAVNANHLAFVQQPTNTAAGQSITPAVTVEVLDPLGNVAMADTSSITIAVAANPSAGTLAGTITEAVVNGVATFSDLSINKTGTGYTFSATDGALTSATSNSFNITPAVADHLVFSVQPTNTVAGQSISPVIHVTVEDSLNNIVTTDTSSVTLAIGTNVGSGTLSGTTTVAAVGGVASFSGLSINKSGVGYTLAAADGALTGAISSTFNITSAAATSLSVHTAASTTAAGVPVNFTVMALDPFGNIATGYANTVFLTSTDVGTHTTAPTSVPLVAGVANFSATLTTAGSQTISATDSTFSAQSNAVLVTAAALNHFAVTGTPTVAITAGTPITFSVTAQDAYNNTVTTFAGAVSFTSTDTNAQTVLPHSNTLTGGVGGFGATLTTAGSQTITAFDGGISGVSAAIPIVPAAINLTQSSVAVSPANVAVGATAIVTLQMRDAFGNSETTGGLAVVFSTGVGTGTGTLTAAVDNHNGTYTANFTGVATGSNTISATVNSQPLTSSAASVVITAGASVVNVSATPVSGDVFGQAVALSANVLPAIAGAGVPTGTVSFYDGAISVGNFLGSHSLSSPAVISVTSLSVGTHTIIASYSGDANFAGNNAQVASFVVSKASSTTVVAATPTSAVFDQTVTFTATINAQSPGSGLPIDGGTITFYDGSNPIGIGTLSGGAATFSDAALSTGTHTITASYAGDADFNASTGALTGFTVAAAGTSTAVTATPGSGAVYGQPVTLTASVTANSPSSALVNGGTVTFHDGSAIGAVLGVSSAVANGLAAISTSILSVGNHTVYAVYSGVGNFTLSTGASTSFAVGQASTSLALVSSAPISGLNTPVSFTASVSALAPSGAAVQTGSVVFTDTSVTPAKVLATLTLNGANTVVFTTSALSKTVHAITATYADNAGHFSGSTAGLTQTVTNADTITVTSSANPSVFGQTVNLTVKVAGVGVSTVPTGPVTITQGGALIGSGTLNAGSTVIAVNGLAVGANSLTVNYGGDSSVVFAPNSKALVQTVKAAVTKTTLTPVANTIYGLPITLTAAVAITLPGAGSLVGGTVTFKDGAVVLGTGILDATQHATFTTLTSLAVGRHTITAVYGASTDFAASTSAAIAPVVTASATTTTLAPVSATVYGQSITFIAAVVSASGANVVGAVTFKDGAKVLGAGVVSGGLATFTTSTLATNVAPGHSITAVFGANIDFAASTSAPQIQAVSQIGTMLSLTSSTGGVSVAGQSVTFSALVSALSSGGGNLTGTVSFFNNGALLGKPVALTAAGTANLTTSALTLTSHNISAVYNGAANYASSSNAVEQDVSQADTTVALSSSLSGGSTFGQAVTFVASVAVIAPGVSALTGTVTFYDDDGDGSGPQPLGTVNVAANGVAKFATATLPAGSGDLITATYNGSNNLISETSAPLTQTVNALTTTTAIGASPASNWAPNQPINFTAKVVAPGVAKPTGTVTFYIDGVPQTPVTLSAGVAVFNFTGFTSAGPHTVNAVYAPDTTNDAASTSATLSQYVLNPVSIALNASDTSPSAGELETLTASITGFAGTPTGTVTFYDGTKILATVPVDANGNATYSSTALSQGFHNVSATYSGDINYPGATSALVSIGTRFV